MARSRASVIDREEGRAGLFLHRARQALGLAQMMAAEEHGQTSASSSAERKAYSETMEARRRLMVEGLKPFSALQRDEAVDVAEGDSPGGRSPTTWAKKRRS